MEQQPKQTAKAKSRTADKVFLKECFIHDTNQYYALEKDVWNQLEVSETVYLLEDDKKVFVSLYEVKGDVTKTSCKKIGVLADDDAESIIKYLKMEWANVLYECKLSRVDKGADENKRLSVAIYIKDASATK